MMIKNKRMQTPALGFYIVTVSSVLAFLWFLEYLLFEILDQNSFDTVL